MGDADLLRTGTEPLILLATTINYLIVKALARRPMSLVDLRQVTGLPAQTTLRGHLSSLVELGVIAKRPATEVPYAVVNELTPAGHGMLRVAEGLEGWLSCAPEGPLSLETGSARGVVKTLAGSWASTMLSALARRPMSLTELDATIPGLSYPALERRLASMRMAGLVEAAPTPRRGTGNPYALTQWGRQGVLPLAVASHWERVHMRRLAPPLTRLDVEAAFMLSVPLVDLPGDVAGRCLLTVEGDPGDGRERTGVEVTVEGGRAAACAAEETCEAGPYASGTAAT